MKNYTFIIAILILFAYLSLSKKEKPKNRWPNRRILLTDDTSSLENCCKRADSFGIKVIKQLPFISGMVCEMEDGQDHMLLTQNQSFTIENDAKVFIVDDYLYTTAIATDTINLTGAPYLWKRTKGQGISVAVIDTGISQHPDLKIVDGVSTLGDVNTDDYLDDNGHGTHVAGVIAANGGNRGILGMAPDVELFAIKALDKDGSGFVSDIVEGIAWAIEKKAHIANLSLGTSESSEALQRAVRKAAFSPTILVAAAGNTGQTNDPSVLFPARYSEVISVGSVNNRGVFSSFSSYGKELDILAYGENILSTYLGKSYRRESGTSMAAPQISGALALILGLGYRNRDALRLLYKSAKKLQLPKEKQGQGLIDLSMFSGQY